MRAQYQVLAIPFRRTAGRLEFAAFRREDDAKWQFIAGGGEDHERPAEAALREAEEEAGLSRNSALFALDSQCMVSVRFFKARKDWPKSLYVIPEYCFAIDAGQQNLRISDEHTSFVWAPYDVLLDQLAWDSNKTAMWELAERIRDHALVRAV